MRSRTGLAGHKTKHSAAGRRYHQAKNRLDSIQALPLPGSLNTDQSVNIFTEHPPCTKPGRRGEVWGLTKQRGGWDSFLEEVPPVSPVCPRSCKSLEEPPPTKQRLPLNSPSSLGGHSSRSFGSGCPLPLLPLPSSSARPPGHPTSGRCLPLPPRQNPPHTPAHISFSLPQVTGHEGPSSQPRPPSSPPQGLTPAAPPPLDCPACPQTPSGVPRLLKQNPPSTTHSTRCSCGLVSLPHSTVSTRCLHFLLPPTPPLHQGQGQRHHTGHLSLFSGPSWPPLYAQHPQPLLSSQDPQLPIPGCSLAPLLSLLAASPLP